MLWDDLNVPYQSKITVLVTMILARGPRRDASGSTFVDVVDSFVLQSSRRPSDGLVDNEACAYARNKAELVFAPTSQHFAMIGR
jgi:hypothetical protein